MMTSIEKLVSEKEIWKKKILSVSPTEEKFKNSYWSVFKIGPAYLLTGVIINRHQLDFGGYEMAN